MGETYSTSPLPLSPTSPLTAAEADGDWDLAAAIATAAAATPGVLAVQSADPAAATYGPGMRVEGICLSREGGLLVARLHLVLGSFDLAGIAARARESACRAAAARQRPLSRVDVHVEDVLTEAPLA